jgi:GST-like protein
MIDFYAYVTPNNRKVSIALEELGLPYSVKVVDLTKGDQHKPEYLAINPNNKTPAIVDHDVPGGLKVFESGAILVYLAEKTGRLMPTDAVRKAEVMEWLMFQVSGVGPMIAQLNYFGRMASQKLPLVIERFQAESERLMRVLDKHLSSRDYLASEYSIADMAMYPYLVWARQNFPELFTSRPGVLQWMERVGARPAVQRGMNIPDVQR